MSRESAYTPPVPVINKKIFMSWKSLSDNIKDIHKYLLSATFLPDAIVTAHKGGLIPATILSYSLKLDAVYTIKFANNEVIYPKDIMNLYGKNILIVENLIERGEKAYYMNKFLENFSIKSSLIVTVVQKETAEPIVSPNFAAKTIKNDEWVVFPWEELNY